MFILPLYSYERSPRHLSQERGGTSTVRRGRRRDAATAATTSCISHNLPTEILPSPANFQTVHSFCQRGDLASLVALHATSSGCINERDAQNVTPLHWAAINAHMGVCRWLLDEGAEVDAIGGDLKATPLHWASRNGHLYVMQLLLSRGADPSLRDAQGFSALQLVTHSSAVMPLLYMVSLPSSVHYRHS